MTNEGDRLRDVEEQLRGIQERNLRVESDKAWETSAFRTLVIEALIYVIAALFLASIGQQNVLLNAFVPTIGYLLSIQTLPMIKRWWVKRYWGRSAQ